VIEYIGSVLGERLDIRKLAAGAALNHVGADGEWATGETDQRNLAIEFTTYGSDGIKHVAERLLDIGYMQISNCVRRSHRIFEFWAFSRDEMQAQAHRVGNGQDVGKQNRRIELVAPERLQGYLAGQLRIPAKAHEVTGLASYFTIFRQVAARLPHDPHGCSRDRLAHQGAQKYIVFEFRH